MSRYFWIKNINNDIIRFPANSAQRIYFDIISELELMGVSIEMLINKARQLGMSTITAACILHRAIFTYGSNATIASSDQAKTAEMSNMIFLAYDLLPWWMPPQHTRRVESDRGMLVFGGQRSQIKLQHGTQTGGISQGTTPTVYHLSEVAYYNDPESLIEVGLFKAVHPSPKVFGVLESTACGDTGWWAEKYHYYKREWPNCRMLALFLPWFLGSDLYPNKTWLRKSPDSPSWRPIEETSEMKARAELYVASNPVLAKVLGLGWELTRDQQRWWQEQFLEARDGGRVKKFLQEYPTDDEESFQGSFESVFGRETIAEVYSSRERNYKVYGIVGQSIETSAEPFSGEVDYSGDRIPLKYASPRGDIYRWELVPLLWKEPESILDIREVEIPAGLLMIFKEPELGYDYSIGVDTSTGVGDEATVIAVSRRALTGSEPDIQAAEFRSNLVSHVEAYPYVMAIAAYYSKYLPTTTRFREPYVSIEQVAAVGDTVYKDMWKMGYSRFHKMKRYDSSPKTIRKSAKSGHKIGWFTFSWSRPILIGNFILAIKNGWYVVNSPWTLWEMKHFETHSTSGKAKEVHSEDSTDDGIFANAIAWLCPNDLRSLSERTKKKCQGPDAGGNLPPVDVGEWGGQELPTSLKWQKELEKLA
jgi:hypothetical protein